MVYQYFGGACNITMREHSLSAPEAVQVCDATMLSKVITAWYQIKFITQTQIELIKIKTNEIQVF